MSEFKRYCGPFIYSKEGDDEHLYKVMKKVWRDRLKLIKDHKIIFPFEDTDYKLEVGGNIHPLVKVKKLPFQVRIQELPRQAALQSIKELTDFVIYCMDKKACPSDIHEGNMIYTVEGNKIKTNFVDLNAFGPASHKELALAFVRLVYLLYRYVYRKKINFSASKMNFAMVKSFGGWASTVIDRNFKDPSLWQEFKRTLNNVKIETKNTHWSKNYAKSAEKELAKNPKIAKVLEILESIKGGTLLDVGCNKGYVCSLSSEWFDQLCGFDYDEKCIEMALMNLKPNTIFCKVDIKDFATPARFPLDERYSADVVVALAVTHHFQTAKIKAGYVAETFVKLARKHILIEDIAAIHHYDNVFKNSGFERVLKVDSYPTGRKLSLWKRI